MLMHVVQLILTYLYPILQKAEGRRQHFIVGLNFFVSYIKKLNLETLSIMWAYQCTDPLSL